MKKFLKFILLVGLGCVLLLGFQQLERKYKLPWQEHPDHNKPHYVVWKSKKRIIKNNEYPYEHFYCELDKYPRVNFLPRKYVYFNDKYGFEVCERLSSVSIFLKEEWTPPEHFIDYNKYIDGDK